MVIFQKFHHVPVFLKKVHQLVMNQDESMVISKFKEELLNIDHNCFPEDPTRIVKHYHDAWWINPSFELSEVNEPVYSILDRGKLKDFILQVSNVFLLAVSHTLVN